MICEKCLEKDKGTNICTICGSKINISPGKTLIKVTGILFIIVGGLGLITSIPIVTTTIGILNVINCFLYIVVGISGIKYCKYLEKAKLLVFLVISLIIFGVALLIISSKNYILLSWTIPIGFILHICFLLGACKNLIAKGKN